MQLRHPILTRPVVLLLLFTGWAGCGGQEETTVEVVDSWARPMLVQASSGEEDASAGEGVPPENSAVYLTIRKRGGPPDTLLGARSPAAHGVEIHESFLEGDIMRMREVGPQEVRPGEDLVLRPGGLHLMLLGLRRSLAVGDTLSLELEFQGYGLLSLRVPVLAMAPAGR